MYLKRYTRLDPNGGTVNPTKLLTNSDYLLNQIPDPQWADHDFLGWYDAAEGGNRIDDSYFFTSNKTIYAHWKERGNPNRNPRPSRR